MAGLQQVSMMTGLLLALAGFAAIRWWNRIPNTKPENLRIPRIHNTAPPTPGELHDRVG